MLVAAYSPYAARNNRTQKIVLLKAATVNGSGHYGISNFICAVFCTDGGAEFGSRSILLDDHFASDSRQNKFVSPFFRPAHGSQNPARTFCMRPNERSGVDQFATASSAFTFSAPHSRRLECCKREFHDRTKFGSTPAPECEIHETKPSTIILREYAEMIQIYSSGAAAVLGNRSRPPFRVSK